MTINHGSEDKPRHTQETRKTVQGQSVTALDTSLLMGQKEDNPQTVQEMETYIQEQALDVLEGVANLLDSMVNVLERNPAVSETSVATMRITVAAMRGALTALGHYQPLDKDTESAIME